jgi:glycosyltransferase involved in cell wall biosynthesis
VRVAWTGATVGDIGSGSVAVLSGQLLMGLLDRGVEVDFYSTTAADHLPQRFREHPALVVVHEPVRWGWNRWYSSNRVLALVTSLAARALAQGRLSARLIRNQRRRRYDCIFQFSQTELLLLGLATRILPPIVVHPSTTAGGELEWHRRESKYALEHENVAQHYAARAFLRLRAGIQRRQLAKVKFVVGASDLFRRTIEADYAIPPEHTRLLPHPIDIEHYADVSRPPLRAERPLVLLFASRLSARKGLELVLGLSHRLDDLAGEVKIAILGATTMWSDYSGHAEDRNPRVADFVEARQASDMKALYASVDIVLAPSHWEPFSLITAEALAAGVPVIASDQIGAAEGLDPTVCRIFPAGDLDALERRTRELVAELREPGAAERLAEQARAEARVHFSQADIGARLHGILEEAIAR